MTITGHIMTVLEFSIFQKKRKKEKSISNKNITPNIFRMQVYDSVMYGYYFCTGFIDFMFKGNIVADFTNLFSPSNFKDNDKIISKLIQ